MQTPDPTDVEIERARAALHLISKTVLELLKPPPGPYAFFHHNGHALAALQDCANILKRLRHGRAELSRLHAEQRRLPESDTKPDADGKMPAAWNAISNLSSEATELMKLDLETLYVFGGILLDQWSLLAIAVGNITLPKQHPFRELVDHLDRAGAGVLTPLWDATRSDMLWLHYQLRFYRNRFIVHANRPWQRGTTASFIGPDFNLHTPTPPGWLDDIALDAEITELMHLAPDRISNTPTSWERAPGRLIEVLFDQISDYGRPDRETISRLYGRKGGSTPSFHVLALRLFRFVAAATETLVPIAQTNISILDLGHPHSTSAELFARRSS